MNTTDDINELLTYDISGDGRSVRMHFKDVAGRAQQIDISLTCVNALMRTLPRTVQDVAREHYDDPDMMVTYPLGRHWAFFYQDRNAHVLTLSTPDEFSLSFALSEAQLRQVGKTAPKTADELTDVELVGREADSQDLVNYEPIDDMPAIRITFKQSDETKQSLVFPIVCLVSLMMTLPAINVAALRVQHKDPTLTIAYPVEHFEVLYGSNMNTRILTLKTLEGFSISYSMSETQQHDIGQANFSLSSTESPRLMH